MTFATVIIIKNSFPDRQKNSTSHGADNSDGLPKPAMTASRPPRDGVLLDGIGYESPGEDFFSAATPPLAHEPVQRPVPASAAVPRPAILQRSARAVSYDRYPPSRSPPPQLPFTQSSPASLNDLVAEPGPLGRVGLRDRIACYEWTFFTMTMATGGIANVLHSIPSNAAWIHGVGVFFLLLNLVLFTTNCIMITIRFRLRPGSFIRSFTDQKESLFVPAFVVSLAVIFVNTCQYGIPQERGWLLQVMRVMFWLYIPLCVVASAGIYLILWSTLVFPLHTMTPIWIFPAYPLLLTAPFAGQLIRSANSIGQEHVLNTTAIALCAVTTQGTGCFLAILISAAFIYRLMTQKLPHDMQRPGIFISIGPYAFTAAGIVSLGGQANAIIPNGFLGVSNAADIMKVISVLVGLWFWGFSMWFFLVSVGSLWKYFRNGKHIPFNMTWWSFVFPNTALVTATQAMGEIFDSQGIRIFGSVMAAALVFVWACIFATMIRCFKNRKLLWPKTAKNTL
ncbi:voltage-dependent anion channel-domain-containing protein [Stachybotrys elegans]|uniref:Voltage-dependent anion channel-domain-containing protein n=1 Tax=Stachybotrys elegans TaxID=80388 RepID=A0A8K0SK69_9HYPO|nr:voltage-dependent anion channel-domain-containing protein [Stachybotrys elegans]